LLANITDLVTFDAKPFNSTFLMGQSKFTFAAALHLKGLSTFTQFNQTNSTNSLFFGYVLTINVIAFCIIGLE
jgi:hypothetical protein